MGFNGTPPPDRAFTRSEAQEEVILDLETRDASRSGVIDSTSVDYEALYYPALALVGVMSQVAMGQMWAIQAMPTVSARLASTLRPIIDARGDGELNLATILHEVGVELVIHPPVSDQPQ